jgi:hypothetical protein
MSLEKRAAFKLAFLSSCAEAGLTLEETHDSIKQAVSLLRSKVAEDGLSLGSVAKTIGSGLASTYTGAAKLAPWLLAAAAAVPPAVGYAAGSALGSMSGEINDRDITDVKLEEVLEAYRRETERARARNLLAAQRSQGRQSGRPLLV